MEARFIPWSNKPIGGFIRWVQDGTYSEKDSTQLCKKDMIEVAKSGK